MTHPERRERRRRIAKDIERGDDIVLVCKTHGVCASSARIACHENGVALPQTSRAENDVQNINAMVNAVANGESVKDTAKKFNVTTLYIRGLCKVSGIDLHRRQGGHSLKRSSFVILYQLLENKDTRASIAARFGITRQRVQQIATEARAAGFSVP